MVESAIGMSLAFAGFTMIIVQGGLTRVIIPRLGEQRAAVLGIVGRDLCFLGYAFAPSGWMMYA